MKTTTGFDDMATSAAPYASFDGPICMSVS